MIPNPSPSPLSGGWSRRGVFAGMAGLGLVPLQALAADPPAPQAVRMRALVGDFHRPPPGVAAHSTAVMALGGSEGGLRYSTANARDLARSGFPAFAVAYFGAPGLPPQLEEVPLEYFFNAIDWLAANAQPRPSRIVVMGHSRGAEAALLVAANNPAVGGVAAFAPGFVANQSYRWDGQQRPTSAWTLAGAPVPFVPTLQGEFEDAASQFRASLAAHPDTAKEEIPVEKINGPILLVSSTADRIWPAADYGDRIMARLKAHGFAHPAEHLKYPDASHLIMGMGEAPTEIDIGGGRKIHFGGTADGTLKARNDAWAKTLAFLAREG